MVIQKHFKVLGIELPECRCGEDNSLIKQYNLKFKMKTSDDSHGSGNLKALPFPRNLMMVCV